MATPTDPPEPPRPAKARLVHPPAVAPSQDAPLEDVDRRPPPERRRPPGRGGSTSRDAERSDGRAPSSGERGRGGRAGRDAGQGRGTRSRDGGRGREVGRDGDDTPRQSRRSTPSTPGGARGKPIGADQARRRSDAPRRAPSGREAPPPRPDLPIGDRPNLPKTVLRDLERTLGPGRRADEVALALSVGSQAIDEGAIDIALEMLAWAKDQAPRVAAIREAHGVARYLAEDYTAAVTEIQAYARISGRNDQNHVLADALRALERGLERVEPVARALVDDARAPAERRAEAAIVLAAALAEAGRLDEGREVLAERLAERRDRDADHHRRIRSVAAELALQAGDRALAIRHLEALAAAGPDDSYDAEERLAALEHG